MSARSTPPVHRWRRRRWRGVLPSSGSCAEEGTLRAGHGERLGAPGAAARAAAAAARARAPPSAAAASASASAVGSARHRAAPTWPATCRRGHRRCGRPPCHGAARSSGIAKKPPPARREVGPGEVGVVLGVLDADVVALEHPESEPEPAGRRPWRPRYSAVFARSVATTSEYSSSGRARRRRGRVVVVAVAAAAVAAAAVLAAAAAAVVSRAAAAVRPRSAHLFTSTDGARASRAGRAGARARGARRATATKRARRWRTP